MGSGPDFQQGGNVLLQLPPHLVLVTKYKRPTSEISVRKQFSSPLCFASSCGGAPLVFIREYINQQ
jgi:hypothetical protein